MAILVNVLATFSLIVFTIAALVGFTKSCDPNTFWSKRAVSIKKILKKIIRGHRSDKWLDKPYSLTNIGLYVGCTTAIISIWLSYILSSIYSS